MAGDTRLMKILYLIAAAEIGGTEKMVIAVAKGLQARGHDPVVVTLSGGGMFPAAVRSAGIRCTILDIKRRPGSLVSLLSVMRNERPDVLHTFLFIANILGRCAGRMAGVPVLFSSQRSTDRWRKWYHWLLDGATAPLADCVVSNSVAGRDVLIRRGIFPDGKIEVVPNGVPVAGYPAAGARSAWGIGEEDPVIGATGNLRTAKGHEILIRALPEITKEFPLLKCVLVGEGPLHRELECLAGRLGVENHLVFTGFQPEPVRLTAFFDVFLQPSLWEGMPVGLLEAMALKRACIATPVGDVPEMIVTGENGILVPPGDVRALARETIALLKDAARRRALGERAFETVRDRYSEECMIERYETLYRRFVYRR